MSRLFYLLRNNRQSGPYSPEILAALPLTQKDLVKIAGQNSGWFHPHEMGLPFTINGEDKDLPEPVGKDISPIENLPLPDESIDDSIEQLSKKVTEMHKQLKLVEKTLHSDVTKIEKEKGKTAAANNRVIAFIIIGALLAVGGISAVLMLEKNEGPDKTTALEPPLPNIEQKDSAQLKVPLPIDSGTKQTVVLTDSLPVKNIAVTKKSTRFYTKKKNTIARYKNENLSQVRSQPEEHTNYIVWEKPVPKINYVLQDEGRASFVKKLFGKKKDLGSGKNMITNENIEEQLPVIIRTTNYVWLKGVQGLVLTLGNNSSQFIKQAVINVVYYNDQNMIMEKQTLFLNNIEPGKTQSIAAPDHPRAHHAGYEIVSATVVKVI